MKKIRRYFLLRLYTKLFVILGHFLPFYPTNKSKNQNFDKMKKTKTKKPLEILSFYICLPRMTIIWCIVYRDIEYNRQNLFSFWTIFCPFTEKSKFWKKTGDIISLHLCPTNDNHMMYGSLDISWNRQNFLWTIFCPFNPSKNLENKYF